MDMAWIWGEETGLRGGSELPPPGSLLPAPNPGVSYLASTPDTWGWCGRRERVNRVSMGQRHGRRAGGQHGEGTAWDTLGHVLAPVNHVWVR